MDAKPYPPAPDERCYACGRKVGSAARLVVTSDGQPVYVGGECYSSIARADEDGWQPSKGGPRLHRLTARADQ